MRLYNLDCKLLEIRNHISFTFVFSTASTVHDAIKNIVGEKERGRLREGAQTEERMVCGLNVCVPPNFYVET